MSLTADAGLAPASTNVTYKRSLDAFESYQATLIDLIRRHRSKSICDIGGGANPVVSPELIESLGLRYTVLDISQEELHKASPVYDKLLADICDPKLNISDRFDFVFSKMVAEHVKSADQFHENIFRMLTPGGVAFHCFPTLYTFPFLVNRLVPESLSTLLLKVFRPRDLYQTAKFPAYYDRCVGPTRQAMRWYRDRGWNVLEYHGFFGHGYYARVPVVRSLHERLSSTLIKHPVPTMTSYAWLVLQKPVTAVAG